MYFVYIIQSRSSGHLYLGFTHDLKRRLLQHNQGKSLATKFRRPWVLVYYEAFRSKKDAYDREIKLKRYKNSFTRLKQRITNSLL